MATEWVTVSMIVIAHPKLDGNVLVKPHVTVSRPGMGICQPSVRGEKENSV